MATATPSANGRKSLASQIDRLDGILDGLAEGLNDAIAMLVRDAVTVAVKETVQSVVTELLTNPAVLAKLQAKPQESEQPAKPKTTLKTRMAGVWKNVVAGCAWVKGKCEACCEWVKCKCKPVVSVFAVVNRFRLPILIALVMGMLCGFGTHLAGSWLSVLVSGVGGVIATLAIQVLLVFRSLMISIGDLPSRPTQNDPVPST